MSEPQPVNGCPAGSSVCDRLVTGNWPDVVFLALLLGVCAWWVATVLVDLVRRWWRR